MHILNFSTTFFLHKLVCHYYSGCFKALQEEHHFDVAMLAYFALIVEDCTYYWTQMFTFRYTPQLKYEFFFLLLMMPFVISGYVLVQLCMFVRSSACIRQWAPSINHARPGYFFSKNSPQSNSFPDRLLRPEVYTEDNYAKQKS